MVNGLGLEDRLHDHVALDEIELYAEVLIAVADTDRQLSPAEIDRALGLTRTPLASGTVAPPPDGDGVRETDDAGNPPVSTSETTSPDGSHPQGAPSPREPAPSRTKRPCGGDAPDTPSETRYAGPVPPARDGHRPPTFVLPVHGAVPDGASASRPLCDVVLPHFVPWRAWHL